MTEAKTASRNVGPIDVEDEYGGTVTLAPLVVQPVEVRRGQVIPEGKSRGETKSRTHDAADEERKSAMRAFFRTAGAEGLDTSPCSAERMRREIAIWLGRPLASRRDVATGEWIELQTALLVSLAW